MSTCLKGPEAAALFYDPERFKREGAMPSPIRKTLLGEGGVQVSTARRTGTENRFSWT